MRRSAPTASALSRHRLAVVTNLPTHYRRPLFVRLADAHDVDFYFTSSGDEDWWLSEHELDFTELTTRPARRRLALFIGLLRGRYDCVAVSLVGRLSLLAAIAGAKVSRTPLVVWVGLWEHPSTFFHRLSRPLTRMIYRRADAVLVYGTHVARYIEQEAGRTENVVIVPQAVDNERFRVSPPATDVAAVRERVPESMLVALYVGRVEEEKGLDYLIAALASSPSWGLIVVGTGSLLGRLERTARDLGIDGRLSFAGYVPQEKLPAYLHAVDVLVLPSVSTNRFREPWGLVVNEAMNAGLPVITTDAVGAAAGGLVDDSFTGFVVPQRDATALAEALTKLESEPSRRDLGGAGRKRVNAWSYEAATDAFVGAVEKAIAS